MTVCCAGLLHRTTSLTAHTAKSLGAIKLGRNRPLEKGTNEPFEKSFPSDLTT